MMDLKRIYPIIALLILSACNKNEPIELGCIPADMVSDVVAFYPFTDGSLSDFSSGEHHLTNVGGAIPAADRDGNATCAYEFDNLPFSNQLLVHNNPTFLDGLDEFSISMWYMPIDPSRNGGLYETLIARDSIKQAPDRSGQWSIGLYDCRQATFGRTNSVWEDGPSSGDCDEIIAALTGEWKHVVVTCDKGDEKSKIYIDGNLQESKSGNSGSYSVEEMGDLFLGRDYTGRLDDVIIFKSVLSNSEVKDMFKTVPESVN